MVHHCLWKMSVTPGACIKPGLVRRPFCHKVNLPSCVARRPLCQKVNLFIQEIAANFNNFQGSSTSMQKLLLTWCCTCSYQLPKALRLHKNVPQNNFCNTVLGFHCLHLDCVLFRQSKWCPTLTAKSRPWYVTNLKYDYTTWRSCASFH